MGSRVGGNQSPFLRFCAANLLEICFLFNLNFIILLCLFF